MANGGSLIPVKSAGCGQLAQGFYNKGWLQDEYHMKKGDIVFFNWDGGSTPSSYVPFPSVDHVGIVESVGSNGNFTSIEGNTGSSPYGEVKRQNRNIKDVSCVAHPQYNSSITADKVLSTAKKEIGTAATAVKVCKYNTWFYGFKVSGTMYDWCAAFVCWCFYHTEGSSAVITSDTIDVSSNNGTIDWNKVKNAGIKYAIIRIGWGDLSSQKDKMFETNYKNARSVGIKVGGYYVSYIGDDARVADYVEDAKLEAEACLTMIKGKTFELPIYHDLEVKSVQTKKISNATLAFCKALTEAGYKAGVYASNSFFDAYLDYDTIKSRYSVWLAQWGVSSPSKKCDLWQYTEEGSCNGITTNVDLSKRYTAFGPSKVLISCKIQLAGGDYLPRKGVILNVYRILKSCGYSVGKAPEDGVWTAELSNAIKIYQKKFGLTVNGILDEKTALSLFSLEK